MHQVHLNPPTSTTRTDIGSDDSGQSNSQPNHSIKIKFTYQKPDLTQK